MIKYISQKGVDGFGHQLLGIMSLISLTSDNIVYVPYLHDGNFEHVDDKEKIELKEYLVKFYDILGYKYPHDFSKYPPKRVMDRNLNNYNSEIIGNRYARSKIPTEELDWEKHTHVFDNAWSETDIGKKIYNYNFYNSLNNELLLDNNFNSEYTNIVIHLRGGDVESVHRRPPADINKLNEVIGKLKNDYSNYYFHFHTNNNGVSDNILNYINDNRYKVYGKSTKVLFSLSQMLTADILIVADSTLSIAASYVNKGKIIVPQKLACCKDGDEDLHPIKGRNAISLEDFLVN